MRKNTGRTPRSAGRALLPLLLGAVLTLTGCWGVPPLHKTGLVVLLGLDAASGGQYQVTVAMINPLGHPLPMQGGPASKQSEVIREATASDPIIALAEISALSYLSLDFTHIRAVIVSEALARKGLSPAIDFIERSTEFNTSAWLLIAHRETATSIIQGSRDLLPDAGSVIASTALWSRGHAPVYPERLSTVLSVVPMRGVQATTAGVSLEPSQGKGDTKALALSDIALFRSDHFIGWLHSPASLGWLVANNHLSQQVVGLQAQGQTVVLRLLAAQRKVKVIHTASGPNLDLQITVLAKIVAAQAANSSAPWTTAAALQPVETAAAAVLTKDVRVALTDAQADQTDVFSFGEYVRLQDPADWTSLQSSWSTEGFPHLPVHIQVQVHLRSSGETIGGIGTARRET